MDNLGITENGGRWSTVMNENVEFYGLVGDYNVFFSNDAFVFGKPEEISEEETHERHEKMEHGEEVAPIPWTYFKIEFENPSKDVTIYPTSLKRHTVHFQDLQNPKLTVKTRAFDTLTYKNLYPNIDLIVFIHPEGGLKYNFIVHPGGNYAAIKMNYVGINVNKSETGELTWENKGTVFTDRAPTSFVADVPVKSAFILENNQVSFKVEEYDSTATLLIDPWVTIPLGGPAVKVLEVSTDKFGNCIASVGYRLFFYDNTGTLLWNFAITSDDVSMNPATGDIYSINKFEATLTKIDTFGDIIENKNLMGLFLTEVWRIKYDENSDRVCTGQGGISEVEQLSILDPDLVSHETYNMFTDGISLMEDCALFEIDPSDGSFYYLPSEYVGGMESEDIYGDILYKLDATIPTDILWETQTNYDFWEIANSTYASLNGVNGIACGMNYVYIYDGNKILKLDKNTGTHLDSLYLGALPKSQYGIDIGYCGRVFVGANDSILIFSEDLAPIGEFLVPGTCYDLVIAGDYLNVTGDGFIAQFNLDSEADFEITTTSATCDLCDGSVIIAVTSGEPPFSFTLGDETNLTGIFTDLCPGEYTLLIEDSAGCDYDYTINILGESGLNLSLVTFNSPTCYGFTDGSITVTADSAGATYTWFPENPIEGATFNSIGAGTYTVYAELEGACTDSLVIELIQPDSLFAELSTTNPLCFGDATGYVVVDSVYNAQVDLNNISFVWSPDPTGISGVGADSLYNMPAGNYLLTMTDDRGCSWVKEFSITTPESITFSEFGAEPAFCRLYEYQSGNGVLFAAAIGGTPDYDYLWENLDNGESTVNSTWGGLNPGNYRITVTDANGCVLTQTLFLDSLNPIAAFSVNSAQLDASLEGTELVIANFINESSNFSNPNDPFADTTFFWNLNHPQADWFISNDFFELIDTSYVGEAIYEVCLVALNKNGCSDTTCKELIVHVQPEFMAPNVFSPDADGINDGFTFEFKSLGIETFSCVILNRWGIKVAEFNNVTDVWNGTDLQGDECTDGVYFYTYKAISTNQTIFEGQGNVQLLRNGN
jgi:hypothetical protein